MGAGFLIALFILGGIREIFGSRTLIGISSNARFLRTMVNYDFAGWRFFNSWDY